MDRRGAPRWTDTEDTILLAMQRGGAPAPKIVEALSATGFVVTRSAVLGRIHRLRKRLGEPLKPPPKPAPKAEAKAKAATPPAKPVVKAEPVPIVPAPAATGSPLGFFDPWPRRACRYPVFAERVDPNEPVFCGAQTRIGTPYCEHHYPIVYHPQPKREFIPRKGRLT